MFAMETEFPIANASELLCPCGQVNGKRVNWLIISSIWEIAMRKIELSDEVRTFRWDLL